MSEVPVKHDADLQSLVRRANRRRFSVVESLQVKLEDAEVLVVSHQDHGLTCVDLAE